MTAPSHHFLPRSPSSPAQKNRSAVISDLGMAHLPLLVSISDLLTSSQSRGKGQTLSSGSHGPDPREEES